MLHELDRPSFDARRDLSSASLPDSFSFHTNDAWVALWIWSVAYLAHRAYLLKCILLTKPFPEILL